jgi:hypothetical protein
MVSSNIIFYNLNLVEVIGMNAGVCAIVCVVPNELFGDEYSL